MKSANNLCCGFLCTALLIGIPQQVWAEACSVYWPSAAQTTHSKGKIIIDEDGVVLDDSDSVLQTKNLDVDGGSNSCGSAPCTSSNILTEELPVSWGAAGWGGKKVKVDGAYEVGFDGLTSFQEIKVEDGASLTFSSSYSEYSIKKLKVGEGASVVLNANTTYWVEELELGKGSRLTVSGDGTARVFAKKKVIVKEGARVNSPADGAAGNPASLFVYSYDEIKIEEDATFSGIVYAKKKFELKEDGDFFGSVSSRGEVKIGGRFTYDETAVAELDLPGICTGTTPPPTGSTAAGFNCIQNGHDPVTGRLFTRIAGSAFIIDVAALRDDDGDGSGDTLETNYAADSPRTVALELVDASGPGACNSYPVLAGQTLVFDASHGGRIAGVSVNLAKAYAEVGCRITDATDSPAVVSCSSDKFAVRPSTISLDTPALDNAGNSGTPIAITGSTFLLSASTVAGYNGTPSLAPGPIEAHAGAVRTGTLSGSFAAADPATGQATGNTFAYDEVGSFRFLSQAIHDTGFTLVDQAGDCVDNSYSNVPDASGRVGCDFANATNTAWVGRFIPDHFVLSTVDDGSLQPNCSAGGFSYAGESIVYATDPELLVTAHKLGGGVTQNYSGDYMKLLPGSFNIPLLTADAGNLGADGSTPVELIMSVGIRSLKDNGNGTVSLVLSDDIFEYSRTVANRVAPYTSGIALEVTSVTDGDGVAADSSHTLSPAGVQVRHGRLALANAHGSELQTLPVGMRVEHFAGPSVGYVANTLDTCSLAVPVMISDMVSGDGLLPGETCVWDAAGYSGNSCATAGDAGVQYLATPSGGAFNLNLKGPGLGNTGQLALSVDAPDWLEFNWSGAVDEDPGAIVTFGVHNRPSNVIFMRQVR